MIALRFARATWDVLLLADDKGRCEVLGVLETQVDAGGKGMVALLERVARHGPPTNNVDLSSPLDDGIFEFRKGAVRLLWFYDGGRVVVGCNAYKKQGQKLPSRHLDTAKSRRDAYLNAKRAGTLEIEDLR